MTGAPPSYVYVDRETSWLHFGHRVLQEASDPSVPLLERLFFCGIFSSNLDEYFRVRVASLRALLRLGRGDAAKLGIDPNRLLHDIHRIVLDQQEKYGGILGGIFQELAEQGIRIVDETSIRAEHRPFVEEYFDDFVAPLVEARLLEGDDGTPFLRNHGLYLVVEVWPKDGGVKSWIPGYALVEVPESIDRFVTLPPLDGVEDREVMFLDDVIRLNMRRVCPDQEVGRAYAVKLTRDADLGVDDEFDGDLVEAIRKSLANREIGLPSRFLYDMRAPYVLVHRLQHALGLAEEDMVLGGRYHNLNDLMAFPRFDRDELAYPRWTPLAHPTLASPASVLEAIAEGDQVVHMPYQSFDAVVRFLDEAASDPDVEELWLTVYRVAGDSAVLRALLRAAEAGKRVTVFMEVQARFDEATNLAWADRLDAAGARILYSMPGLKVHAKIAMVVRREDGARVRYAYVGTGNFNEKTARVYADHGVFTRDERITRDVEQVFLYLAGEIEEPVTEHLLVAPFTLRTGFEALIEHEGRRAVEGAASGMTLKMNALEDTDMIRCLYDAAKAGVPIDVIVRGICRLVPGVPGLSESVRVRSILDRYLEHARIYIFHHDGEERMYLASADWMKRNLSRRVEVALPVYDPEIRRQLRASVDLQLADDCKARVVDGEGRNVYASSGPADSGADLRAQRAFREFLQKLPVRETNSGLE